MPALPPVTRGQFVWSGNHGTLQPSGGAPAHRYSGPGMSNMGSTQLSATQYSSAPYGSAAGNTCDSWAACEGNLESELRERQRLLARFDELAFDEQCAHDDEHTEADLAAIRMAGARVVDDDSFPFRYHGPADTLCLHGRGVPEPYYACSLDTYGPSISQNIGAIRDGRNVEKGEYIANMENLRNDLFAATAFKNELKRTNSGDPLGLSLPRHPAMRTMADAEALEVEARAQPELALAQPPGIVGGSNHEVGREWADRAPFGVQKHVRSVPPPPVPCAW